MCCLCTRNIIKTTVSHRYQTVIPAGIRERYNIREGTRIAWIDQGGEIKIIPLPAEPGKLFRGAGKGKDLLGLLMKYREKERKVNE
ncbi:AbrB/MazE/SpoVT family DNA-binding domain-containing protein [Desulfofundulus salinus]|uniref:AbrB/MazE/SpoVT family DNA-binding domain-containing protein n=1 Tax=Desulfofundulus salinus TaxID=2419843 RepID=UPI001FAB26A5|nr:AbrB/MazE/SpoVT family DNA-binding domain-containing protein [Desulfofundulus salinum]